METFASFRIRIQIEPGTITGRASETLRRSFANFAGDTTINGEKRRVVRVCSDMLALLRRLFIRFKAYRDDFSTCSTIDQFVQGIHAITHVYSGTAPGIGKLLGYTSVFRSRFPSLTIYTVAERNQAVWEGCDDQAIPALALSNKR